LNLDELPPQAQQALEYTYQGFVQSSDRNKQRYAMGDPTLQEDFLKFVEAGMITPSRQGWKANASRKQRTALPQAGQSGAITRKPQEKDTRSLDQRIDDTVDALMADREG